LIVMIANNRLLKIRKVVTRNEINKYNK
jgi:hypothetical protein